MAQLTQGPEVDVAGVTNQLIEIAGPAIANPIEWSTATPTHILITLCAVYLALYVALLGRGSYPTEREDYPCTQKGAQRPLDRN